MKLKSAETLYQQYFQRTLYKFVRTLVNGNIILNQFFIFYTIDNFKIFATKDNQPYIFNLKNLSDTLHLDNTVSFIETQRHYSMGEQFFQIVKQGNKFGIINSKNEIVIPIIYDDIKSSQNWRYFLFKAKNKIGILNINGQVIKESIYDNIELRKEYVVLKRKNKKDEFYSYQ